MSTRQVYNDQLLNGNDRITKDLFNGEQDGKHCIKNGLHALKVTMPEKPPANANADLKPKGFCRAASFKMKRKVKNISRALSLKKKSWDISETNNAFERRCTSFKHKSNKWGNGSVKSSDVDINQNEATYSLLAGFDEVYQCVLETSRDLATEIEKLENTPKRIGSSRLESTSNETQDEDLSTNLMLVEKSSDHHLLESDNFEEIDALAVELSQRDYKTLEEVVDDVTDECQSKLEKARALFRWIVASLTVKSSLEILDACLSGNRSVHKLYQELCSLVDIDCQVITGWSKSAGYRPAMSFQNSCFRNSWTAVSIGGTWRFVNCSWAARHVTGTKTPETVNSFEDFYFCTDPESHFYQNFPDDPTWQLLHSPLSLEDFTKLPVLKPAFFRHELALSSPYEASIKTEKCSTQIRVSTSEIHHLRFGSTLESTKGTAVTRIEKSVLQRFVGDEVIFQVNLPEPGQYYLSLFVGEYAQPEGLETACVFRIDCSETKNATSALEAPFPPMSLYGPTPVMSELGLSPENTDPLIVLDGSTCGVNFDVSSDVNVTHSFQYFDSQSGSLVDCDRQSFAAFRTNEKLRYSLACSQRGYYIFTLYASAQHSLSLDVVYKCLVVNQLDNPSIPRFPVTHSRWMNSSLNSPTSGIIKPNTLCKFQMNIPHAIEVFVSVDGKNHHLARNSKQIWEGDVLIGSSGSVARVMGGFIAEKGASPVATLLDFDITDQKETAV